MPAQTFVLKKKAGAKELDLDGLNVFETDTDSIGPEEVPENVELVPTAGQDIIAFARTPVEMAKAQDALIAWAQRMIAKTQDELGIAQSNYDEAHTAKIRTSGWRAQIRKCEKELRFRTKIHAALSAGYFMVPDFPISILAVRTTQDYAADTDIETWRNRIRNERHEELAIGEGDYKDAEPRVKRVEVEEGEGDRKHKVKKWTADGVPLRKMDFPFRLVRPHLLRDLKKATDLKIFDEIGVLPGKRRSRDPMLIGTVSQYTGSTEKRVQFLIAWWIPTEDI